MNIRAARLAWVVVGVALAIGFLSGCTFLPVKTPRPGSTIVHVLPPDSKISLALYLPDARWRSVVKIEKEIVLRGEKPYIASLRELMLANANDRTAQMFPDDTSLLSEPTLNDGVLYLNFSGEVQQLRPTSELIENLLLESLVRTLTEHKEVTAIQILVEGQKVKTLAGNAGIMSPLTRAQFDKKK